MVPSCNASVCIRGLTRLLVEEEHHQHDNGSNFTADEMQQYVSSRNIIWNFNPPTSTWSGGIYEEYVSVKRCLKKILGKNTVTYEELQTILYEIQIILKNRPLTLSMEIQITCYLADA